MASRAEIQEAVNNEDWQRFRISLKGKPTMEKLRELQQYLVDDYFEESYLALETEYALRKIRVDNYLKALARGGQIKLTGPFTLTFSHVTVKKEL